MLMRRFMSVALVLAVAGTLVACEDDEVERDAVAGSYIATEFSITTGSGTVDLLDLGGSITMMLHADGTTDGTLVVPAVEGNSGYTADLAGTWDLDFGLVVLDHAADTLLRDMVFEFDAGHLVASEVFADGIVDVSLVRAAVLLN